MRAGTEPVRMWILAAFLSATLSASGAAQAEAAMTVSPPGSVIYTIRPVPLADRTDLEVELTWTPHPGEPLQAGLVEDCYGVPDLAAAVVQIEAREGSAVSIGDQPLLRSLAPSPDGRVRLRYRLSFDPIEMAGWPFSPSTGPDHVHVANCQWMLRLGDPTRTREHQIAFDQLPSGWLSYATVAQEKPVSGAFQAIASGAIGASIGPHRRFMVEDRPVDAFASDDLALPAEDILDAVEAVVRLQRAWMNDFDFDRYTVVVRARAGFVAGTAPPNFFVAFVRPDVRPVELLGILSHEMFHSWIMGRLAVAPSRGPSAPALDWFNEGVTEYLGRRALLEAGLIDSDQFVGMFNSDLRALADHPHATATLEQAVAAAQQGRYGGDWKKLGYFRGALIGLVWDHQLRRRGGSLHQVVADLVAKARTKQAPLTEEELFQELEKAGIQARADVGRWIHAGSPIQLPPDVMGPGWAVTSAATPSWLPGFDLRQSFSSGVIAGVDPDGPAWQAGLRDGLTLVRTANAGRFTNGFRHDEPLTVVVLDQDDAELAVSYRAEGPRRDVPQITRSR